MTAAKANAEAASAVVYQNEQTLEPTAETTPPGIPSVWMDDNVRG
jgi:hypothetical protein